MKVLIAGGGNLGYHLAKNLLESGNTVGVIELQRERCETIADELNIPVMCGDGTTIECLAESKAGAYDAFVAVTGKDEDNLIACEIAKRQFGIKKTVSRSNNPKNIYLMKKLGIDIAVNTTQIITDLIEHEMDGAAVKVIANITNSDAMISEYKIPDTFSLKGKKVMELGIPEGCVLVYVIRQGELLIPRGDTRILGGDEITALTVGSAAKDLKKLFEI